MNDDIKSATDQLVRMYNEKVDGYRIASQTLNDDNLSSVFNDYADANLAYADQLVKYSHAGVPSDAYRTDGKASLPWPKLKVALAARNPETILDAFIKKEGEVLRACEELLEDDLPKDLNEILQDQIESMMNAQRHLQREKISEYS